MESVAVRIPKPLYEHIKQRAIGARRSTTQQTALLLETALAHETIETVPEPWPGESAAAVPLTAAEDDFPPVTIYDDASTRPELNEEPDDWVAPATRADEITPDWK